MPEIGFSGEGYNSTTTVTATHYEIVIGKGTIPSTSYIKLYFTPTNTDKSGNYNLMNTTAGDVDGDGVLDTGKSMPKMKFVKRNTRGINIVDEMGDDGSIIVKLKGGYTNTNDESRHETLVNLGIHMDAWWEYDYGGHSQGIYSVGWKYDGYEIFGNGDDILPYNPDVGYGGTMFTFDNNMVQETSTEYSAPPHTEQGSIPIVQENETPGYSPYQKEVCAKEPTDDAFSQLVNDPSVMRVCPTCIPNAAFSLPSDFWTTIEEPWLNEATCEYTVRIYSEKPYGNFLNNSTLKDNYVRKGIVDILLYYNKVVTEQDICSNPPTSASEECRQRLAQSTIDTYLNIYEVENPQQDGSTFTVYSLKPEIYNNYQILNPNALELYARAKETTAVTGPLYGGNGDPLSPTYIKVTIPANLIDILPEDTFADESDEMQEELQSLDKVVLKGSRVKNTFKKALGKLFNVYSDYQALYKHSQGGRIRIDADFSGNSANNKPYYFKRYPELFETFYYDLKDLLSRNGYKLYSDQHIKSGKSSLGTELNPSGAKFREAVEVKIIFENNETTGNPFNIRMVQAKYANCPFKKCSKAFSKFKEKYDVKPTLMCYVAKSNDMMEDISQQRELPYWRDFSVEYTSPSLSFIEEDPEANPNAESCLSNQENIFDDLMLESNIAFSTAIDYVFNSLNCKDYMKYDQSEYTKLMAAAKSGDLSSIATISGNEAYLEKADETVGHYKDAYNQLFGPDSGVAKFYGKLTSETQREKGFFEKLTGKTIETAVDNLKNKEARKEFIGEMLEKINPCNWEALTIDIINCLLKGLDPIDAIRTAARSLLKSQDPIAWEKIWIGLSEEQRADINEEIQTKLGGLPTPWQFKQEQTAKGVVKLNDYESQRDPPENPNDPANLTDKERSKLSKALQDYKLDIALLEKQQSGLNSQLNDLQNEYERIFDFETLKTQEYDDLAYDGIGYDSPIDEDELNNLTNKHSVDVITLMDSQASDYGDKVDKAIDNWASNIVGGFVWEEEETRYQFIRSEEGYDIYKKDVELRIEEKIKEINAKNNEIILKKKDSGDVANSTIDLLEDEKFRNDVNAYEKAVHDILRLLIDAYTEALVNTMAIDDLRALVNSIPGSEVLGVIISTGLCAKTSKLDELLDEVIGGIELNPCMGKYGWYLPDFEKLPEFNFLYVLKYMLAMFVDKIVEMIFAALTKFLLKLLLKILARACDVLSGIGFAIGKPDESNLLDAIADAFCSRDDFTPFESSLSPNTGAPTTLQDIIYRYSGEQAKQQDVIDWARSVSGNLTSRQFLKIFAEGTISENDPIIQAMWLATEGTNMSSILQSPQDIHDLIITIGSYLTREQRSNISGLLESLGEQQTTETYQEFCVRYLCSPGGQYEAVYDAEDITGNIRSDLEDLFDSYLNGPDSDIKDIMDSITLDPGGDPFCEDLAESALAGDIQVTGNKGIRPSIPEELKEFRKLLGESIFSSLEISYVKDLIGTRDSFFNSVLADSDNVKLVKERWASHEKRVERSFLYPNAANTVKSHKEKYDDAGFYLKLTMHLFSEKPDENGIGFDNFISNIKDGVYPVPSNLLPKTVGLWMFIKLEDKRKQGLTYKTKIGLQKATEVITSHKKWKSLGFTSFDIATTSLYIKTPDLSFDYNDHNGGKGETWGFTLNYSNTAFRTDPNGVAVLEYGSQSPSYEIEVIERSTTRPPFFFWKKLFGDKNEENLYNTDIEKLHSLQIPLKVANFQDSYDEYKSPPQEYIITTSTTNYRSEQELSFVRFLEDKNLIIKLWKGLGWYNEEQFSADLAGTIITTPDPMDYTGNDTYNLVSSENSVWGKIKESIYQNIMSSIYSAAETGNVQIVYNATTGFSVENISNSFMFGYTNNSELNYTDLLYVNPQATSDPTSWKYTYREEQKVLGKSATENPRVVFLDPEFYGGTYRKPKIYIHPYRYKGWMGIMQTFLPEIDGCAPEASGWLFLEDIGKRVSKLENTLTRDKRMSYDPDCITKRPFDLVASVSTHAYLDGIVTATMRTYIVEFILRTLPTLSNLSYNALNYDNGLGMFFLSNMKEQMKDFPKMFAGGMLSRRNYWYIFLEQVVQTVERRIIAGEMIKDENLSLKFAEIKQIKDNYYYPNKRDSQNFKKIKTVTWDSQGIVSDIIIKQGTSNISIGKDEKLIGFIDAVSFCAFGNNFRQILKNQQNFNYKSKKISLKELRFFTKVYEIYLNEDLATNIASELLMMEFTSYQEKLQQFLPSKPYIHNLTKFIINPKSGATIGPRIEVGTIKGESSTYMLNTFYGDVVDCVDDPKNEHILDKINFAAALDDEKISKIKASGAFYLEKYVFYSLKEGMQESITDIFTESNQKVISVAKFQDLWSEFCNTHTNEGEYNISDFFGSANLVDGVGDEKVLVGSIGIKFGVRLAYMPPSGWNPFSVKIASLAQSSNSGDLTDWIDNLNEWSYDAQFFHAQRQNPYYAVSPSVGDFEVTYKHVIPLIHYEQDVKDAKTTRDFNVDENLKCYVDKLCESQDYKYLMEYIFNVKSFANLSSIYSFYAFPDSIGEDPSEREGEPKRENDKDWTSKIMEKTKLKCFRLFKKFYLNEEVVSKSETTDPTHSKSYKKLSMPEFNLNLNRSISWWQKKRFYDRPFDKDGKECTDGALASFNQFDDYNAPRTDFNDYEYLYDPAEAETPDYGPDGEAAPIEEEIKLPENAQTLNELIPTIVDQNEKLPESLKNPDQLLYETQGYMVDTSYAGAADLINGMKDVVMQNSPQTFFNTNYMDMAQNNLEGNLTNATTDIAMGEMFGLATSYNQTNLLESNNVAQSSVSEIADLKTNVAGSLSEVQEMEVMEMEMQGQEMQTNLAMSSLVKI